MIRTLWAALAACLLTAAAPAPETLIRGARVFDGSGRPAQVRDVLVRGDRIAKVARRIKAPVGATQVDGAGMTLLPGLHDLHIHTPSRAFESAEALGATYRPYLAHGVTSVNEFSVSGPMLAGIRALDAGAQTPHLMLAIRLGVPHGHGTESDFTNGITLQVTTPAEAHAAMAQALGYRPDLIKVFADGWRYGRDADRPSMDEPTLAAIVADAHRAGIPVVTHTVTLAGAKIAAKAGVDALAHGIGDAPVDAELIRLMRRHRTAYVPTLAVYEPQGDRAFLPAEWAMLDPAAVAREQARLAKPIVPPSALEAKRWAIMQGNAQRLKAAGIRVGVGTDTGIGGVYRGSAAVREVRLLVQLGWTPAEALKAATRDSARILRRKPDHGRIARGQRADLVLIDGRPDERIEDLYRVARVWVSGRDVALR
ncbi:amidohydrolase family protein [Sphingomonas hengshuiensis]|uniref:amidohydrolase family protein n=1 Tax=Sphingomonas hengshuiensis TaxID=1609977 RepID=UPI000696DFFF|nr:amidohydrolase family protein [Sphingomonas hengshuiensis]